MNIEIRSETPEDAKVIHDVTQQAFRDAPHTDHNEQFIVSALREAGALCLSLVAEHDQEIVGHVAISPVVISDGSSDWYGLGPISALPRYQGQGVGVQLVERALADLKTSGAAGCVLLGDPAYSVYFVRSIRPPI